MSQFLTRNNLLFAAILLLAAFLRAFRIDTLPPGFQFDQAYYALDAIKLVQGEFAIFFYEPGRSEPLYQYLLMPFIALFGADSPLALKITAGIIGILTIPLVYGITRSFFASSSSSNSIGLAAAFFTAISFWHIFYNRYGERIPLTLFMATLTFWFLWRALTYNNQPRFEKTVWFSQRPWRDYIFAGIFTGLTLYTYPSGRIVPIAIVVLVLYAMLTNRKHTVAHFKGLTIITLTSLVVFMPLGAYYIQHPANFFSHTTDVSIFVPHGKISDNVPLELGKNAIKILQMFFIVGDSGALRNLPYRPIFDPLAGTLFTIGIVIWLIQLVSPKSSQVVRIRAVFFGVWLGLALGLTLISDDAPNNGRALIGLPIVMILPALGLVSMWERIHTTRLRQIALGIISIVLVGSTAFTYNDYFNVLANDPETYYAFDTDKVELANWINSNAKSNQLYLAPLVQTNSTISLLTRTTLGLHSFESRDTVILPSREKNQDAIFVFPWEQEKKIQTMADRLGALGTRDILKGSNGGTLALLYRIPAANLPSFQAPLSNLTRGGTFVHPQHNEQAVWANSFELLGYSIDAADNAKRNLEVTLFFHVLEPIVEDYTFSIKVRDSQDRAWGQEDKWLGNNSYPTTAWMPGDIIIEKFYPGLNACAPAGDYRISVEAYNPKTSAVLGLSNREGNSIIFGSTRASQSPSNRLEDLEPDQTLEKQIDTQLNLMGYSLSAGSLKAGEAFSLALFWRGAGKGSNAQVSIRLQDTVIKETTIQVPVDGRGVCAFFDLTVPNNVRVGSASLAINNFKLTDVEITK